MKWILPLQVGSLAGKNKEKIIRGIRTGRFFLNTYVVMLPFTKDNQLEIMQASELKQPYYKKNEPTIVGIAIGKSEAIGLVAKLIEEAIAKCGSADARKYIEAGLADGSLRIRGEADIADSKKTTVSGEEAGSANVISGAKAEETGDAKVGDDDA